MLSRNEISSSFILPAGTIPFHFESEDFLWSNRTSVIIKFALNRCRKFFTISLKDPDRTSILNPSWKDSACKESLSTKGLFSKIISQSDVMEIKPTPEVQNQENQQFQRIEVIPLF